MIYNIYSIKDVKTGFLNIHLEQNDAAATRNFGSMCMNDDSLMHKFPNDYSLYLLGTFDTEDASIELQKTPKHLADGYDFV